MTFSVGKNPPISTEEAMNKTALLTIAAMTILLLFALFGSSLKFLL